MNNIEFTYLGNFAMEYVDSSVNIRFLFECFGKSTTDKSNKPYIVETVSTCSIQQLNNIQDVPFKKT